MKCNKNCQCYCHCCKPMTLEQRIIYICDNEYEYFFKKANVVGVGLGYKATKGVTFNDQKCIKVLVSKKFEGGELPPEDLIPPSYNGVQTDVIESGVFKSQSINVPITPLRTRIRPVFGGYVIGPSGINSFGTLGCLVTDGDKKYVLSNNHLLAQLNTLAIGTPILQPNFKPTSDIDKDTIAHLSKYIPIQFDTDIYTPVNYTDCAIAELVDDNVASSEIALVGKINGTRGHRLGQLVKKVGASSGLSTGMIKAVNVTTLLDIKDKEALFKKQILTSTMALPGDSGAVLLNNNNYVLGLLMAGNDTASLYNSIFRVLSELNVNIVSN